MNSNEFLNEVLHSEFCPDHFEEIYEDFCHYQKLVGDTLKVFHNICEANGLTYLLAYGSLLGMLRDGGQIPWDYDADVLVPVEEREMLIEALQRDLPKEYSFYCPENNRKYCRFFIRIVPKGYDPEYLHLDVFYLMGLPDDAAQQEKVSEYMRKLAWIRYCKYVKARKLLRASPHKVRPLMRWGLYKLYGLCHLFLGEHKAFLKLAKQYPVKTASASCNTFAKWTPYFIYRYEVFKDAELLPTELGQFRIPKQAAAILTEYYGDYENVPPLDARIQEVVKHCDLLKRFAKLK